MIRFGHAGSIYLTAEQLATDPELNEVNQCTKRWDSVGLAVVAGRTGDTRMNQSAPVIDYRGPCGLNSRLHRKSLRPAFCIPRFPKLIPSTW